jgi:hypothetical protein
MNESPVFLSDEALSQLIFEAKTTVQSLNIASSDVFDRVRRFNHFYNGLATKPDGVALLYQDSMTAAMHYHPISHRLIVGRLAKSERHSDGCDLACNDDEMSRRHFEIALSDGFYVLRDLDSSNGTAINSPASLVKETVLKAGDVIFAGRAIFVFTGD